MLPQEKLWPTLQANWALWPLANWIAFRFLSGDMRILYANIIGVSAVGVRRSSALCLPVCVPKSH